MRGENTLTKKLIYFISFPVSYAYLWAVILTFRRQVRDCMTVSQRSLIRTV